MKILYIWDGNYPWDIRAEKVCGALIEQNHEVFMVCRNTKRQVIDETYNGIRIRRLPYLPNWLKIFDGIFTFPAFFNPVWIRKISKVARENQIDVTIVRDLPMALGAIKVGKAQKIPVILDMAECYPEMLRCIWKYEKFRFQNIFIRNPYLADVVERKVLKNIDAVMVMIEESYDRLIKMGVDKNKVNIVSNTPDLSRFRFSETRCSSQKDEEQHSLNLIYLGLLNPSRGLDTVIEGVAEAEKQGISIRLSIYGSGKDEQRLKSIASELGVLGSAVKFKGWIDNSEIPQILKNCDAGIVPHHVCSHWDNTIPNKLFDYMASEIPVLSSNVKPMRRIIEACQCGVIYDDFDPLSFVDATRILLDKNYSKTLGKNGYDSIVKKYNWDMEKQTLLQVTSDVNNAKQANSR